MAQRQGNPIKQRIVHLGWHFEGETVSEIDRLLDHAEVLLFLRYDNVLACQSLKPELKQQGLQLR